MTFSKEIFISCLKVFLASIALISLILFSLWYGLSPNGSRWMVLKLPFFLLVASFLTALGFLAVSIAGIFYKKFRNNSIQMFLGSIIYFMVTIPMLPLEDHIRMKAFHNFAERPMLLIPAIKQYVFDKGTPPKTLASLIPAYLAEIPSTGIGAYPNYQYITGDKAKKWNNNSWVIYINTPIGMLNWDIFLYLPNQNYPEKGYGGVLERIGQWAYVHE